MGKTDLGDIAVGKSGFIEQHGLWDDAHREAARRCRALIEQHRLETIRIAFADQHGVLRAKTLSAHSFLSALKNAADFTIAPFVFDTASSIVFNAFTAGGGFGRSDLSGFPDLVIVPDPTTFRILPWAQSTGWVLGDLCLETAEPFPYLPRNVMKRALARLHALGLEYVAGLEVEWYLTKIEDAMLEPEHLGAPGSPPTPPRVRAVAHGYQYMLETHLDEIDDILQILRRNLEQSGLPLRTMEDEFGPGQQEFTFDPLPGLGAADAMVFFRGALKQICRRHGYHATFMCRPGIPGFFASGWHLHQSLIELETGANVMPPPSADVPMSPTGLHVVGGILEHARGACLFSTPTINGYRRVKPNSLAPDRAAWGIENKGAMVRLQGGVGDPATHIENRVGEPAANPYLYMASQIVSLLDGMERKIDPGPPSEVPYADASKTPLPKSIDEAIAALKEDAVLREGMGGEFVDYLITLKEFESRRYREYLAASGFSAEHVAENVTEWEHREYFDFF